MISKTGRNLFLLNINSKAIHLSLLFSLFISFLQPASAVDFPAIVKKHSNYKLSSKPAYCEMKDDVNGNVKGYNNDILMPIASVSKVFTSFWAIKKLGPDFRFITKVYITPTTTNHYNVHLEGSKDPYFSYEKIYLLLSELNKKGVKNIDQLTFDENLRVNLLVRSKPDLSLYSSVSSLQTKYSLENVLQKHKVNNGVKLFGVNWSAASQIVLPKLNYDIRTIELLKKSSFEVSESTKTFVMKSDILKHYLKDLNIYSNNYSAGVLWEVLGGKDKFDKFMQQELGYNKDEYIFHTGSGLPITNENGTREDNLATCNTVINVLNDFDSYLNSLNLGLKDILQISGYDNGTLRAYNWNETLSKAVSAKTGTVNVGIGLAGYVSTQDGNYYFGTFFRIHQGSTAERTEAKKIRDNTVTQLIREHNGKKEIQFSSYKFITFDRESVFSLLALQQRTP